MKKIKFLIRDNYFELMTLMSQSEYLDKESKIMKDSSISWHEDQECEIIEPKNSIFFHS